MGLLKEIADSMVDSRAKKLQQEANDRYAASQGQGSISATPRNYLLGAFADSLGALNDYAQRPDPSMPMGKANPVLGLLADTFGLPGTANTVNELSYGNYGALGTGSGMTWKPKQDTVDAVTTLLPLSATAGKAALDGGVKLAHKATPAIESAVNRTMANGGKPAQLLGDLAHGTQSPMVVWHGSPHRFDKFDSSKIGTGEGAQAYGHGLYLAESPDVAGSYANNITGPKADPKSVALKAVNSGAGDDFAHSLVKQVFPGLSDADAAAAVTSAKSHQGSLYKVDLPDEQIAKMLDWDKPLSQQAPEVQKALQSPTVTDAIGKLKQSGQLGDYSPAELQQLRGEDWYDMLRQANGDSNAAPSDFLKQQGIPGIRYLDGGSRGTGQGTSNFVVFPGNEDMLKILERNGQPMGLMNDQSGRASPRMLGLLASGGGGLAVLQNNRKK